MGINSRIKRLETRLPLNEPARQKAVAELDEYMRKKNAEYNSPEQQEKRRKEYEELQDIGRKRKEACEAGLPMNNYPLPWENKGDNQNDRSDKSISSDSKRIPEWLKSFMGNVQQKA